jgi:dTDP-4-amino-4,6-dideoxygalactose transaminase
MDRCFSFHNLGRPHGSVDSAHKEGHPILGAKCRMAEYQASILLTQMMTFEAECRVRTENAEYLTSKLKQLPGIVPRMDYPSVTRPAFYYYGFRYKKEQFAGLPRDKFVAALQAEGIHASAGLGVIEGKPMNKEGCLGDAFQSKAYQRIYPKEKLSSYQADNECPLSDLLVEETVGFHQSVLLASRKDLDDITNAITKIYENRHKLSTAG